VATGVDVGPGALGTPNGVDWGVGFACGVCMGLDDWATLPAGCWLHPITNALKRNEVMKTALKRQRAERCSVDNILMNDSFMKL
jgi:hypothetical protein